MIELMANAPVDTVLVAFALLQMVVAWFVLRRIRDRDGSLAAPLRELATALEDTRRRRYAHPAE